MDDIEIVELDTNVVKNKIPWGTIIPFIVLLLIIGVYFIYDIFFKKENIVVDFNFKEESITMNYNSVYELKDNMAFENLDVNDIHFSINNDIVKLETNALISSMVDGEVLVTATYKNINRTMKVIVSSGIDTSISLNFLRNYIDLNKNGTKDIYEYLSIKNIDKSSIKFSSTNSTVAYVSDGKIISLDEGETIIKAMYDEYETSIKVVVGDKYLLFKESEIVLESNKKYDVFEYLDMSDVEKTNIIFKSTDNSVSYVENNDIVTRGKKGECILSAEYLDLYTEIKIVVK